MSTAGELVLATLYLDPTAEREAGLRQAAAALEQWDQALPALEAHGVLGLALRNLERAGAALPHGARVHLRERAEVMRAIDLGFRLTLERFASAAAQAGVEVTLLKGASLALDLYPERGLRTQGDLDLLVPPAEVTRAVAVARRIGLWPSQALPVWWYRLAHFHLKLLPADGLQRELELHWHLHPPARLHTVRLSELFARRTPLALAGTRAWTLDPLDRLLHLVTHLARHCPLASVARETLVAWATSVRAPLRMKWLVDVRAEVERRHPTLAAAEMTRRAAEWNAEAELALVLAWIRDRLGFAGAAHGWVERVLEALPALHAPQARAGPASAGPLPGFDLRASALCAFPRWVVPPASYFAHPQGGAPVPLQRMDHAARVLGRAGLVLLSTPMAWLWGLAARVFRHGQRARGLAAEDLLALAARAHQLARTEEDPAPS